MLPSITPSKSPAKSPASRGFSGGHADRMGASSHFEKVPHFGATAAQHLHSAASVATGSPSAHASQAITAMLKTPAVSAQFAVFASPERKMRIDVQTMLNEIHSRPSMAGMLGTGIVSALSAKTLSDTQNSKPLEVRANLDRFIRNKLQDVCTVKDDIIQSLAQKLEAMTAEATRLERALAEEEELSERNVADLEERLHEAMLANKRNVDDDSGDMSPNFSPHPQRSATPFDQSRAASSNVAGAPYCNGAEGDKDSLLAHLGLAARTQSCDTDVYSHARGASLTPQVGMVAPVIADVIDQLHKCRRPQKPIEGSVIITHDGDFLQLNDVELQRQSLRRRMTKISKASEVIECASKALISVLALEDVSHGGGSNQPRRPALATVAVPIAASAAVTANRRGSMIGVQTGRSLVAGTGGEEPLPIDLFLENQQRTDFISHATAAMTMLPSNVCQDFIAEIMRQVSCVGAGLAVASEAIAILSAGNDTSSMWLQAADSLQRVCRVQRVQLYEIYWDSRSLVPIIDGKAQERDDLGISRRIPINHGYAGKCIHMGPTIVNFPASLGQDFQPSDRGEGAVAYTMLALPIGLPGQPPVMVATLINKLVPLGAPQQSQLDALQKGKADSSSFGTLPKQHPPPANADKPPFLEGDVAVAMAVGHFIAQKAMRTRLACGMARLQNGMMARACAMGGAGVGGESVLSCVRSQELCAAMLSDIRAAANWTCIDMMLVFPGPPVLLCAATGIESCIANVAGDKHATNLWGRSSLMIHVVRDHVATSSSATPAAQQSALFYSGAPTKVMTKAVSEESLSQLMAQLATQWLPQNFRKSATFETKSLLQTQSLLLNQIVCVAVGERVVPTEVGTDYAVIQNLDHFETGCVNKGETKTVPLNNVEEIIRYACSDTARGVAQCSIEGRALISNVQDTATGSWKLRYADKSHDPNARIYARMESSSSAIATSARPFHSGASDGHQCMFMPVTGAGGTIVAVLRAEKCVQMQSREMSGTNSQHFSKDELEALDCLGRHCGSILQTTCIRLNEVLKKTFHSVLASEYTPIKRASAAAADLSGTSNVITPAWCVRNLHEKQRNHLEDLCLKASMSLECGKVCILLLEKDRRWLVQLAYAVSTKTHAGAIVTSQGDGINVYEGYKHNGIALSAINSGECVVVPNVSAHVGYDPRLDDLAGIQGRNCLAAPIVTEVSKSSARCVGVLFASNKMDGGFLGPDMVLAGAFADSVASALAGILDKMPQLRSLDEAKPTPVKRSEAEAADTVEMRSMLNALDGM